TYAVTEKPNEHTFPQEVVDGAIQISRQSTYDVVATTPLHTEEGVFHMLAIWKHQHQHHASANPTTPSNGFNCVPTRDTQHYIPLEYTHMGRCSCVCRHCGAMFWECEKLSRSGFGGVPIYNKCCNGGQVVLRPPSEYPEYVKELYANAHFMEKIRAYNQMFSMVSLGANIDSSINNGLIELLDNHNALVQLFRTARNKLDKANVPEFKVKLYNVVVLYTIEFQKRGLPHCHSLLWVTPASKIREDTDVDKYISAELPNPAEDPNGYRIISELMMYGPCGLAYRNAPCMKDGNKCNRNFPKLYSDNTYIDKDGFVHYRRRTGIDTEKQNVWLDNSYVVPYNRTLCMRPIAETSKTIPPPADKGEKTLFQSEIINMQDIKPTHKNKTIEVRVYQKWIAKNVTTKEPTHFCCILLDRELVLHFSHGLVYCWHAKDRLAFEVRLDPRQVAVLFQNWRAR
nr:DNA helicase [Tanacetum cinerariifolium]